MEDATQALKLDDDAMTLMFSSLIVALEQGQPGDLGPRESLGKARQRVALYLEKWQRRVAEDICSTWRSLNSSERADAQDLLSVLIPMAAETMGVQGANTALAAMVVVILLRRGFESVCDGH